VLGVSFDTVEQNAAFARKLGVAFPLLCDVDRSVALAYGACSDPRAPNPERVSFLIDEAGIIACAYERVDPRDHPAKVLADILGV
jgi:thioredoxin-dependent peroxiredoxin